MLRINEEFLAVEDAMETVLQAFLELEIVEKYRETKTAFLNDRELQQDIQHFQELQENYETMAPYKNARAENLKLRRRLLAQKRKIDMNDRLIRYRQAEVEVQKVLAELSQKISAAVSPDIFVDTGLPLAPHKRPHEKGRGRNIRERGEEHAKKGR
ncbi:YlbF family regulator [Streptococcus chenjunshii]|uniref:YlbF family regulator n=2 Tax=Streptococcus chenjunshii TaxID=2173853 RepID=A0A372KM87_9STRE|nr:YlbF family regulator [Streptococcus chenjunshii]RFU51016.1 YlbF family regulator [Streptococcus chenjunshii]RFU53410.1 YlbF family regulator [Streptococcus chenjunshii]